MPDNVVTQEKLQERLTANPFNNWLGLEIVCLTEDALQIRLKWREEMISNILIRTILVSPDELRFNTGGGIVADSVAELEYLECFQKAKGMLAALAPEVEVQALQSVLDSSA